MASFTLTVRNGPVVERERFETLDGAVSALRERCQANRAEGPLEDISMIRDFSASQRVKARIELSTGRLLRRREAGVDVMGDGSVVPFSGGTFRRPIEGEGEGDYADAVAGALRE
jgi:hypothetical protein